MHKRIISALLLVFALLGVAFPAYAAAGAQAQEEPAITPVPYDVEKAFFFARNNWNSGGGCAPFAARCLTAGGITIHESNKIESLLAKLDKLACGAVFPLETVDADNDGKGDGINVLRTKENTLIATKGDLILWYCKDCELYRHVGICGEDKKGYISIYARNRSEGNQHPMKMKCVLHGTGDFMEAHSYHILRQGETLETLVQKPVEEPVAEEASSSKKPKKKK